MGVNARMLELYDELFGSFENAEITDPEELIANGEQAGCFVPVRGKVYFQDQGRDSNALLGSLQLRILADELDRRNGVAV